MTHPRMLFVYNPHAGKATIRNHLLDLIDHFTKAGYEVVAHPTQSRGDGESRVANRGEDYDMVVCSGGDGTLDEVVSGILMSGIDTPIGYVPAGSTNDFAKSLGIPSYMPRAAEVVTGGRDFRCDMGIMNDDYFVYCAAFGIFTDISYSTDQSLKNILGHTAYLLQSVREIQDIRTYRFRVTSDEISVEDDFIYGMVTNATQVGGIPGITGRDVGLDDGEFEVTLIRPPRNPLELANLAAALLGDGSIDSDRLISFKTSHVLFESEDMIPWTRDGEFGGDHRRLDVRIIPAAITIKVPDQ
ncbi:diacylglycerol/lipid kinase family protein [Butyrivibrio sp. MC2013]|uniref:diacylglycerol/lipid kinase family protein n=1 Tax=Butyrivibrio sp. MC2013 TaxID=1280686 RepID=UPI0003F6C6B4|nr:YegS/Rv2252/BmrU family lipid kinase [Butyrivibrio sp. MC2013]